MTEILQIAMVVTGFTTLMAGLIWLFYWSVGQIIKMLGYWKIFYRAMMIAGKQINDERRDKK